MSWLFANNAKTTLTSSITAVDTVLPVSDGSLFPTPTGNEVFRVTLESPDGLTVEICTCTARVGSDLTVTRGEEGTTPRAFGLGATVELRVTTTIYNDLQFPSEIKTTAGGVTLAAFSNGGPYNYVTLGSTTLGGYPTIAGTKTTGETTNVGVSIQDAAGNAIANFGPGSPTAETENTIFVFNSATNGPPTIRIRGASDQGFTVENEAEETLFEVDQSFIFTAPDMWLATHPGQSSVSWPAIQVKGVDNRGLNFWNASEEPIFQIAQDLTSTTATTYVQAVATDGLKYPELNVVGTNERGMVFHDNEGQLMFDMEPGYFVNTDTFVYVQPGDSTSSAINEYAILGVGPNSTGPTDIPLNIRTKGAGEVVFSTLTESVPNFKVTPDTGTAAQYIEVVSASGTDYPVVKAAGAAGKGILFKDSDDTPCFAVNSTPGSADTYIQANGSSLGFAPAFQVVGRDNIGYEFQNSHAQVLFEIGQAPGVVFPGLDVHIALLAGDDATQYSYPTIKSAGSPDRGINFVNDDLEPFFQMESGANPANYLQAFASPSGNWPGIAAKGEPDKGILFYDSNGNQNFQLGQTAASGGANNWLAITPKGSGVAPLISAVGGSDSAVDIHLQPKGSRNVVISADINTEYKTKVYSYEQAYLTGRQAYSGIYMPQDTGNVVRGFVECEANNVDDDGYLAIVTRNRAGATTLNFSLDTTNDWFLADGCELRVRDNSGAKGVVRAHTGDLDLQAPGQILVQGVPISATGPVNHTDGVISLTGLNSKTWTGIPSGAKVITVNLWDITAGSDFSIYVRVGDSQGIETGSDHYYKRSSTSGDAASATTIINNGNGVSQFIIGLVDVGADLHWGEITLTEIDPTTHKWMLSSKWAYWDATGGSDQQFESCVGYTDLTAELDRVQVLTSTGSNFGSGGAKLMYY